jgi:predicted ATP-dependent protease
MKEYLAMRLRQLANFLDPPQIVSLTQKSKYVTQEQMLKALDRSFEEFKRRMAMSRGRRG